MKGFAVVVVTVLAAVMALWLVAGFRWDAATDALVARMTSAPHRPGPARFQAGELAGLPAPVARYLRKALPDGQPIARRARFRQRGTFLISPPANWRPFEAVHTVTVAPAGFVWDARIGMPAGLDVRVRDAFVDGTGHMHVSFAAVVPLVNAQGTPELAASALMRWLAEAAWCPTALLPSQGVRWTALDDSSSRATLREGAVEVSLDFHFGADSLVTRVYSAARGRDVKGRSVPTPWQGRFGRYERCAGVFVPVTGKVEWLLPGGPQPYWRGELTEVRFDYQ